MQRKKKRGVVWCFLGVVFSWDVLFGLCIFGGAFSISNRNLHGKRVLRTILPLLPSSLLHGLLLIYEGKQPFLTTEIIPKKNIRPTPQRYYGLATNDLNDATSDWRKLKFGVPCAHISRYVLPTNSGSPSYEKFYRKPGKTHCLPA